MRRAKCWHCDGKGHRLVRLATDAQPLSDLRMPCRRCHGTGAILDPLAPPRTIRVRYPLLGRMQFRAE